MFLFGSEEYEVVRCKLVIFFFFSQLLLTFSGPISEFVRQL